MAEHKHEWELSFDAIDVEACCKHCPRILNFIEIERYLNALEEMKTWQDGIYTGTQLRNFAAGIYDRPLRDST